MALVTTPTGAQFEETSPVALAYYLREPGYSVDSGETDEAVVARLEQEVATFDPAEHTVDEVNTYLDTAGDDEVARVLDAERAGKNRKGITGEDE